MIYNPKDYQTNRNAVLALRAKLHQETVSTEEAIVMGAKRNQLKNWEKEGKIKGVLFEGKNRYDKNILKALIFQSLK